MELTLTEILERLEAGDETAEVEAKRGGAIDRTVMETVCAMANEPGLGGGYIVLGVSEEASGLFGATFVVMGVRDPGKLQADLATRCCNDLSMAIRPEIQVEVVDGMAVVVVFVAEVAAGEKPVYFKAEGLPRGAFRRIGGTDQHCTDDDVSMLFQSRSGTTYDISPVEGSSAADVDSNAIREYRLRRAEINKDASELRYTDEELLHSLHAMVQQRGECKLTVAGLMLFGKESALRRLAPMQRVDYILTEGQEWVRKPDARYTSVEFRGPLMTLIPRVIQQVLADIPAAFSLAKDEIHRRDLPLVPRDVIREAVVNALMHRNYRTALPVQVLRYTNRIEIRNVGHSLKPEDRLGDPGSLARNPAIAAVLHEAGLAETKGSGIRTMKRLMHSVNLTPPFFESDRQRDTFGLMLLVHHLVHEEDVLWLKQFASLGLEDNEARVLVVIRETGAITNAMYRDVTGTDTLTASRSLLRLRDAGILTAHGKGRATYYRLAKAFGNELQPAAGDVAGGQPRSIPDDAMISGSAQPEGSGAQPVGSGAQSEGFGAQSEGSGAQSEGFGAQSGVAGGSLIGKSDLPIELGALVSALGGRPQPEALEKAIEALCEWRALRAVELAALLNRNVGYLRSAYLAKMIDSKQLRYTMETHAAHPQQAYKRANQRGSES